MKILLTLLLALTALLSHAQESELLALMHQHNVPGMQVVYTKGRRVQAYSLGVRRAGTTEAVTAGTIFQAASLGKVVLAYTALRLLDRGVLDLDKPLLSYAPYPRLAAETRAARITARMVLAHTTGLPNWAEYPLAPGWPTSALHLRYAPDSCWSYSGEGYVWLQKTLEHLTGQSLETLAQQEVFGPLRMASSHFTWQPAYGPVAAVGHDAQSQPTQGAPFTQSYAAYSLRTTATDYSRFVQAIMTGKGLKANTARLLTAAASPANRCGQPTTAADPAIAWACGVGLAATSRGPAQWQWGNNDDFKGFFMTLPGRRESVLFFTNSANGDQLTEEVLRLFLGPGQYWAAQWLAP